MQPNPTFQPDTQHHHNAHDGISHRKFIANMHKIFMAKSPPMHKSEFLFQWTNTLPPTIGARLESTSFTSTMCYLIKPPLAFGSKFWPNLILQPIFHRNPLWLQVTKWLRSGVEFPLKSILDEQCQRDLTLTLQQGNHKSAKLRFAAVNALLQKEVL